MIPISGKTLSIFNSTFREETKYFSRAYNFAVVNITLYGTSPKILMFFALLTCIVTDSPITIETIFVTFLVLEVVRLDFTLLFPKGIFSGFESILSCHRLQV